MCRFQSTQPSQAVTIFWYISKRHCKFQSTQPSQAVTRIMMGLGMRFLFQSTQPSQAVTQTKVYGHFLYQFQSTQPSQAVTKKALIPSYGKKDFNPHSPRRLWPPSDAGTGGRKGDFNPHSPRRLWPQRVAGVLIMKNFNPHSPRRLWQVTTTYQVYKFEISIHTALAGCDRKGSLWFQDAS